MNEPPRKRVLIEASKLADRNMDGIKRYVVELLQAFARMERNDRLDLDVMVYDDIYPLAEIPAELNTPSKGEKTLRKKDTLLTRIGLLIPPILLFPIKWLIPASLSRKYLGKEPSELRLPPVHWNIQGILLLLLPPALVHVLNNLILARIMRFFWVRGWLRPPPRDVDVEPYDLIHHTLPNNYHFTPVASPPVLLTIHDLCHIACPQYQTRANSRTLRMGLDCSVAGGAEFLSVSDSTRSQMIEAYELEQGRITTVHNACNATHFFPVNDETKRREVCAKYKITGSSFLLTLSTIEPRKNLDGVIEAFELLASEIDDQDICLVVAGARGWHSRSTVKDAEADQRVHLTGYVADEDLAALYSSARGFVYVSHYEGFGLPLIEAMSCGTPVIYGDNSSMPEIVGDAGLGADSEDVLDIARQMRRLVSDDELADSLGRKALERSARFSWDRAAEKTMRAYSDMLGIS